MGYVAFAQLDQVYRRLKSAASRNGGTGASTVLIFVSPDADAVCALKILVTLLKSDCIAHKIVPVAGYTDLSGANEDHVENNEELRSIVMLNCGGLVDLNEMFTLSEDMTIYVCDSHRPLNLRSLFNQEQIVFMDDGDIDDLPDLKKAVEELEFEDSDDDDDDENGADDAESEESEEELSENESEPDADGNAVDVGGEGMGKNRDRRKDGKRKEPPGVEAVQTPPLKRARVSSRRRRRREHQRVIAEYYAEGAYYGLSVAGMLYALAEQLGRASNDFLWLSLIGLSDQYLHDRVGHRQYLSLVEAAKNEVSRFNLKSSSGEDGDLDDSQSLLGESRNLRGRNDANRQLDPDNEVIRCDDEFRLMLLRHWTMHESLHYSVYVGTKLGIWKEKGRQRLTNFLVKMGLPHTESQQRFSEMSYPFKQSIKQKLIAVSPRYNMTEIVFPSFYKKFGFKGSVSAPDVVYSLTSLLDWGAEWIARHGTGSYADTGGTVAQLGSGMGRQGRDTSEVITGGLAGVGVGTRTGMAAVAMRAGDALPASASDDESDQSDEDAEDASRREERKKERAWVRNFYIAYDALDAFDLLYHGIHLAMSFQRALVRTGISILEKKLTQTFRNFQLTVLTGEGLGTGVSDSGALSDENDFVLFGRSPAHLGRLAKFLMEAFKEFKDKDLPLVIAALDESADTFLIIGYTGLTKRGAVRKNTFGPAFQEAAERTNARVKHDSFEASIMEVQKEDLGDFLDTLQSLMQ
ncbi:CDC45 family [Powellomyces hirtus]|nr:CDC45 family [Powellomyces hirtus]